MADFRSRQPEEPMADYLKAKQSFELQNTGITTIDLGTPSVSVGQPLASLGQNGTEIGQKNYPTTNLQPGMTGNDVKQLQDYLVSKGYMTQAQVDTGYGIYGPKTTDAVLQLQKDFGVDYSTGPGYWGPRTLSAVQTKSTGNQPSGLLGSVASQLAEIQKQADALFKKTATEGVTDKTGKVIIPPVANNTSIPSDTSQTDTSQNTLLPPTTDVVTDTSTLRTGSGGTTDTTNKLNDFITQQTTLLQNIKTLEDLKKTLGLSTTEPTAPTSAATELPTLKTQYGVDKVEGDISSLDTQIANVQNQMNTLNTSLMGGITAEEGRIAPMEIITGREGELQRQAQTKLSELNTQLSNLQKQKAILNDQYNTKMSTISTIMQLERSDYQTALNNYNTKFNQNLSLYQTISGEQDKTIDNAKAEWSTLVGVLKDNTGKISDTTQNLLTKLETQIGLPSGITSAILNAVEPTKEVQSVITSTDKTQCSVLYKDGTVQTFSTGLPAETPEPTASEKTAKAEQIEIQRVQNELTNYGQRNYVSQGYYDQMKQTSTLSPNEFDNRFKYLIKEKTQEEQLQKFNNSLKNLFTAYKNAGWAKKEIKEKFKADNGRDMVKQEENILNKIFK